DGIQKERELLNELKDNADKVVDTTYFTVHQLRDLIKEYFSGPLTYEKLTLNLVSFGFRYGIPVDADLVMDTRFLPNPFFVDSMRWLDGMDEKVKDFVLSREETGEFMTRFEGLIKHLIPLYWKEGKSYLTIAVGCTGGKHRSVVITEALASGQFPEMVVVKKRHRDIQKP
ncbi:MAG: RNase adapter RapZ, partial [Deltaproteobacteria bacterium]